MRLTPKIVATMAVAASMSCTQKKAPEVSYESALNASLSKYRMERSDRDQELLSNGVYVANRILGANSQHYLTYAMPSGHRSHTEYEPAAGTMANEVVVVLASGGPIGKNQMQAWKGLPLPTILVHDKALGKRVSEVHALEKATSPEMMHGLVAFKLLHELGHLVNSSDALEREKSEDLVDNWVSQDLLPPVQKESLDWKERMADAFAVRCVQKRLQGGSPLAKGRSPDAPLAAGFSWHMLDRLQNTLADVRIYPQDGEEDPDEAGIRVQDELRVRLATYSFDPSSFNKAQIQIIADPIKREPLLSGGKARPLPKKASKASERFDLYFLDQLAGATNLRINPGSIGGRETIVTSSESRMTIASIAFNSVMVTESDMDGSLIKMTYDSKDGFSGERHVEAVIKNGAACVTVAVPGMKPEHKVVKAPGVVAVAEAISPSLLKMGGGRIYQFEPLSASFVPFTFLEGGKRTVKFGKRIVEQRVLVAKSPVGTVSIYLGKDNFVYEILAPGPIRMLNRETRKPIIMK